MKTCEWCHGTGKIEGLLDSLYVKQLCTICGGTGKRKKTRKTGRIKGFDDWMMDIVGVLLVIALGGLVIGGGAWFIWSHPWSDTTVNTTVVGVIQDKGWYIKPQTYWVDIDGTEVNMSESLWDQVKQGEKVRLILSDGYAEAVQVVQ